MAKQNLEILDFEEKETKAGKAYVRFKTNEGWMSCFSVKDSEKLKELKGKTASVNLIESGDFQNIKKCFGEAEGEEEVKVEKIPSAPVNRTATMWASYAKDLIVAGKEPAEAIKIVQDLKKEFE